MNGPPICGLLRNTVQLNTARALLCLGTLNGITSRAYVCLFVCIVLYALRVNIFLFMVCVMTTNIICVFTTFEERLAASTRKRACML